MLSAGEFPVYIPSPDTSLPHNVQTQQKKTPLGIKSRFLVPILVPSTPSHSNLICAPAFSNLKKNPTKQLKSETVRKATKFHLCLPSEAVLVDIHLQLLNAKRPRASVCVVPLLGSFPSQMSRVAWKQGNSLANCFLCTQKHCVYSHGIIKTSTSTLERQWDEGAVFLTLAYKEKTWGLLFIFSWTHSPGKVSTPRQLKLHVAPHQIYK